MNFKYNSKLTLRWLIVTLGFFALAPHARANIGDTFGFGSRAAALGGAGVAWGWEGYAAYSNPAALPFTVTPEKRLVLSLGALDMIPSFKEIKNVIVENDYVSDKLRYDDVNTDYRNTLGESIGVSYLVSPELWKLTVGIVAYSPTSQMAYLDTGEAFAPEYFLHRARTQRPQVELAMGFQPASHFSFGLGLHVAYSLTGNAKMFMQTDTSKASNMRFGASLKPKVAPYLGMLLSSDEKQVDVGSYTAALAFRFPISSDNTFDIGAGARALGPLVALDFNLKAVSAFFYDPYSLEIGGSYQYKSWARAIAEVDYQWWSNFPLPSVTIQNPTSCQESACGVEISPSQNPTYEFRNILIPKVGNEFLINPNTFVRVGYGYRPSIMKSLPTGAGNYLDPARHMMTAGMGFKFKKFLHFEVPWTLDAHVAWHQLESQHVTKTPGNEKDIGSGDQKIGAPGYDVGGRLVGGGVSLTLAI